MIFSKKAIDLIKNQDTTGWNTYRKENPTPVSMEDEVFTKVKFAGINLKRVTIEKSIFTNCWFYKSTMINEASIQNCIFNKCTFDNVQFHDLELLKNIKFIKCKLLNCNFSKITIDELYFDKCTMYNINFLGCQAKKMTFNSGQIEGILVNDKTEFTNSIFNKTKTFRYDLNKISLINGISPPCIYSIVLLDTDIKIKLEFGGYKAITHLVAIGGFFSPLLILVTKIIFTDTCLRIFDRLPPMIQNSIINKQVWGEKLYSCILIYLVNNRIEAIFLLLGVIFYAIRIYFLIQVLNSGLKYDITGLDDAYKFRLKKYSYLLLLYKILFICAACKLVTKLIYFLCFETVRSLCW